MANTIEYMGYVGQFSYEEGDEEFHGSVLNLRDTIHFCGRNLDELKESLKTSVDDYLQWCAEDGIEPQKPYSGNFVVRIEPEVHMQITVSAAKKGVSLNKWVEDTLLEKLEKEKVH